jgi:hypothetical protein
MPIKSEDPEPSSKKPACQLKGSVSDSSTLVDACSVSSKPKIVAPSLDLPITITPKDDDSDDEWISGNDYPQFVNHDETWKTITASDWKRCILPFFKNANVVVVEGGRRVMPRLVPVSPSLTEENLRKINEAVQGLHEAVAEGRAQLRIVKGTTLFTECACCFSDEEDS